MACLTAYCMAVATSKAFLRATLNIPVRVGDRGGPRGRIEQFLVVCVLTV
jgi:hypothetical protein